MPRTPGETAFLAALKAYLARPPARVVGADAKVEDALLLGAATLMREIVRGELERLAAKTP